MILLSNQSTNHRLNNITFICTRFSITLTNYIIFTLLPAVWLFPSASLKTNEIYCHSMPFPLFCSRLLSITQTYMISSVRLSTLICWIPSGLSTTLDRCLSRTLWSVSRPCCNPIFARIFKFVSRLLPNIMNSWLLRHSLKSSSHSRVLKVCFFVLKHSIAFHLLAKFLCNKCTNRSYMLANA